jgi:hypothetical protein
MAAVQFDIVAHSMGGNIVQTWVLLPNFVRDSNYLRGDVHKLITLDTPFLGSPLANRLLGTNLACKGLFRAAGLSIAGGAVSDLVPGSPALMQLQQQLTPLSVHPIIGISNNTQMSAAQANLITIGCANLLPPNGFRQLFGEDNDLIVPQSSEAAAGLGFGNFGSGSPPSTIAPTSVIHTINPFVFNLGPDILSRDFVFLHITGVPTGVPRMVIDLLNQSIQGDAFGKILP